MSSLTASSPLMQPVEYNGQTYFTSQYFHQQYVANSAQAKIKYRWHQDFVRLMKSIEAYVVYLERGDIQEVRWISRRQQGAEEPAYLQQIKDLEILFRAVGFQTLYLLNATGQVAMAQHLDDEVSKQLSVAANTFVAKQAKLRGDLLPIDVAERTMAGALRIQAMLGTPIHIAQQEAVKLVAKETGLDFRASLIGAPGQDDISQDDRMLEPTDLARELGWGENQGAAMNRALEQVGWQIKKIGGDWEPTPLGSPYAAPHVWTAKVGTKTGYNQKWRVEAVRQVLATTEQANS